MAYYNRRQHLINTLYSMNKSSYKNFEVIIVDDGSDDEHRIEDLQNQFDFSIKLFRIEKHEKKHINPCVPTNIAISKSVGDIIIIQNPECFHYDDVFAHVVKNLSKNDYFAYSTVNMNLVNELKNIDWSKNYDFQINNIIKIDINENRPNIPPKSGWYCHNIFRPLAYNFCSAILREDLKDLNGFDERYAHGIDRDDHEFLTRIIRKGMNIKFIDSAIVIHQSHVSFSYQNPRTHELRKNNYKIFNELTSKETTIKVNLNKQII